MTPFQTTTETFDYPFEFRATINGTHTAVDVQSSPGSVFVGVTRTREYKQLKRFNRRTKMVKKDGLLAMLQGGAPVFSVSCYRRNEVASGPLGVDHDDMLCTARKDTNGDFQQWLQQLNVSLIDTTGPQRVFAQSQTDADKVCDATSTPGSFASSAVDTMETMFVDEQVLSSPSTQPQAARQRTDRPVCSTTRFGARVFVPLDTLLQEGDFENEAVAWQAMSNAKLKPFVHFHVRAPPGVTKAFIVTSAHRYIEPSTNSTLHQGYATGYTPWNSESVHYPMMMGHVVHPATSSLFDQVEGFGLPGLAAPLELQATTFSNGTTEIKSFQGILTGELQPDHWFYVVYQREPSMYSTTKVGFWPPEHISIAARRRSMITFLLDQLEPFMEDCFVRTAHQVEFVANLMHASGPDVPSFGGGGWGKGGAPQWSEFYVLEVLEDFFQAGFHSLVAINPGGKNGFGGNVPDTGSWFSSLGGLLPMSTAALFSFFAHDFAQCMHTLNTEDPHPWGMNSAHFDTRAPWSLNPTDFADRSFLSCVQTCTTPNALCSLLQAIDTAGQGKPMFLGAWTQLVKVMRTLVLAVFTHVYYHQILNNVQTTDLWTSSVPLSSRGQVFDVVDPSFDHVLLDSMLRTDFDFRPPSSHLGSSTARVKHDATTRSAVPLLPGSLRTRYTENRAKNYGKVLIVGGATASTRASDFSTQAAVVTADLKYSLAQATSPKQSLPSMATKYNTKFHSSPTATLTGVGQPPPLRYSLQSDIPFFPGHDFAATVPPPQTVLPGTAIPLSCLARGWALANTSTEPLVGAHVPLWNQMAPGGEIHIWPSVVEQSNLNDRRFSLDIRTFTAEGTLEATMEALSNQEMWPSSTWTTFPIIQLSPLTAGSWRDTSADAGTTSAATMLQQLDPALSRSGDVEESLREFVCMARVTLRVRIVVEAATFSSGLGRGHSSASLLHTIDMIDVSTQSVDRLMELEDWMIQQDTPTLAPTGSPTANPTISPTGAPTGSPTGSPMGSPTGSPTTFPTASPTAVASAVESLLNFGPSGPASLVIGLMNDLTFGIDGNIWNQGSFLFELDAVLVGYDYYNPNLPPRRRNAPQNRRAMQSLVLSASIDTSVSPELVLRAGGSIVANVSNANLTDWGLVVFEADQKVAWRHETQVYANDSFPVTGPNGDFYWSLIRVAWTDGIGDRNLTVRQAQGFGASLVPCSFGFVRTSGLCTNVNECANMTDTCGLPASTCQDDLGTYSCVCEPGYTQGGDQWTCDSVVTASPTTGAPTTSVPTTPNPTTSNPTTPNPTTPNPTSGNRRRLLVQREPNAEPRNSHFAAHINRRSGQGTTVGPLTVAEARTVVQQSHLPIFPVTAVLTGQTTAPRNASNSHVATHDEDRLKLRENRWGKRYFRLQTLHDTKAETGWSGSTSLPGSGAVPQYRSLSALQTGAFARDLLRANDKWWLCDVGVDAIVNYHAPIVPLSRVGDHVHFAVDHGGLALVADASPLGMTQEEGEDFLDDLDFQTKAYRVIHNISNHIEIDLAPHRLILPSTYVRIDHGTRGALHRFQAPLPLAEPNLTAQAMLQREQPASAVTGFVMRACRGAEEFETQVSAQASSLLATGQRGHVTAPTAASTPTVLGWKAFVSDATSSNSKFTKGKLVLDPRPLIPLQARQTPHYTEDPRIRLVVGASVRSSAYQLSFGGTGLHRGPILPGVAAPIFATTGFARVETGIASLCRKPLWMQNPVLLQLWETSRVTLAGSAGIIVDSSSLAHASTKLSQTTATGQSSDVRTNFLTREMRRYATESEVAAYIQLARFAADSTSSISKASGKTDHLQLSLNARESDAQEFHADSLVESVATRASNAALLMRVSHTKLDFAHFERCAVQTDAQLVPQSFDAQSGTNTSFGIKFGQQPLDGTTATFSTIASLSTDTIGQTSLRNSPLGTVVPATRKTLVYSVTALARAELTRKRASFPTSVHVTAAQAVVANFARETSVTNLDLRQFGEALIELDTKQSLKVYAQLSPTASGLAQHALNTSEVYSNTSASFEALAKGNWVPLEWHPWAFARQWKHVLGFVADSSTSLNSAASASGTSHGRETTAVHIPPLETLRVRFVYSGQHSRRCLSPQFLALHAANLGKNLFENGHVSQTSGPVTLNQMRIHKTSIAPFESFEANCADFYFKLKGFNADPRAVNRGTCSRDQSQLNQQVPAAGVSCFRLVYEQRTDEPVSPSAIELAEEGLVAFLHREATTRLPTHPFSAPPTPSSRRVLGPNSVDPQLPEGPNGNEIHELLTRAAMLGIMHVGATAPLDLSTTGSAFPEDQLYAPKFGVTSYSVEPGYEESSRMIVQLYAPPVVNTHSSHGAGSDYDNVRVLGAQVEFLVVAQDRSVLKPLFANQSVGPNSSSALPPPTECDWETRRFGMGFWDFHSELEQFALLNASIDLDVYRRQMKSLLTFDLSRWSSQELESIPDQGVHSLFGDALVLRDLSPTRLLANVTQLIKQAYTNVTGREDLVEWDAVLVDFNNARLEYRYKINVEHIGTGRRYELLRRDLFGKQFNRHCINANCTWEASTDGSGSIKPGTGFCKTTVVQRLSTDQDAETALDIRIAQHRSTTDPVFNTRPFRAVEVPMLRMTDQRWLGAWNELVQTAGPFANSPADQFPPNSNVAAGEARQFHVQYGQRPPSGILEHVKKGTWEAEGADTLLLTGLFAQMKQSPFANAGSNHVFSNLWNSQHTSSEWDSNGQTARRGGLLPLGFDPLDVDGEHNTCVTRAIMRDTPQKFPLGGNSGFGDANMSSAWCMMPLGANTPYAVGVEPLCDPRISINATKRVSNSTHQWWDPPPYEVQTLSAYLAAWRNESIHSRGRGWGTGNGAGGFVDTVPLEASNWTKAEFGDQLEDDLAHASPLLFELYRTSRQGLAPSGWTQLKTVVYEAHRRNTRVLASMTLSSRTVLSDAVRYFQVRDPTEDSRVFPVQVQGESWPTPLQQRTPLTNGHELNRLETEDQEYMLGLGAGHFFVGRDALDHYTHPAGGTLHATDLVRAPYPGENDSAQANEEFEHSGFRLDPAHALVRSMVCSDVRFAVERAGLDGLVVDASQLLDFRIPGQGSSDYEMAVEGSDHLLKLVKQRVGRNSMNGNNGTLLVAGDIRNRANLVPGFDLQSAYTSGLPRERCPLFPGGANTTGWVEPNPLVTNTLSFSQKLGARKLALEHRVLASESAYLGNARVSSQSLDLNPVFEWAWPWLELGSSVFGADQSQLGSQNLVEAWHWGDDALEWPQGLLDIEQTSIGPMFLGFCNAPQLVQANATFTPHQRLTFRMQDTQCRPRTASPNFAYASFESMVSPSSASIFGKGALQPSTPVQTIVRDKHAVVSPPNVQTNAGFKLKMLELARTLAIPGVSVDGLGRDGVQLSCLFPQNSVGGGWFGAWSMAVWSIDLNASQVLNTAVPSLVDVRGHPYSMRSVPFGPSLKPKRLVVLANTRKTLLLAETSGDPLDDLTAGFTQRTLLTHFGDTVLNSEFGFSEFPFETTQQYPPLQLKGLWPPGCSGAGVPCVGSHFALAMPPSSLELFVTRDHSIPVPSSDYPVSRSPQLANINGTGALHGELWDFADVTDTDGNVIGFTVAPTNAPTSQPSFAPTTGLTTAMPTSDHTAGPTTASPSVELTVSPTPVFAAANATRVVSGAFEIGLVGLVSFMALMFFMLLLCRSVGLTNARSRTRSYKKNHYVSVP